MTLLSFLFLKGIVAGFIIAAPVGPIGILCIRRTLAGSYALGLATGLGAGLADTFYGTVAAFSIAGISDFIQNYSFYLHLGGGVVLAWLGVSIFRSPVRPNNIEEVDGETLFHGLTSAFFLTVSNPVALLVFAAAFAAMGISTANDSVSQALALVVGVFVGANAWWLSLSTAVRLMHHKLSDTQLLWINRSSGMMLFGFSAYLLFSLI
jgi:threonine/homoserine/homoserine lactone efflux protein